MSFLQEDVPIDVILLGAELQEIIEKLLTEKERQLLYCYLDNPRSKPSKRLIRIIEKIRLLHEQKTREVVYGYSDEPSAESRDEG